MKRILKTIYQWIPFKRELFTFIKCFYTPPHSIYQHLYFKGKFKAAVGDRYFYIQHYGYQDENKLFWEGVNRTREALSMNIWIQLCKKARVILDVGSNTGIYALVAKTVQPAAKVYAFDPVSRIMEKCAYNARLNNFDIQCLEVAISNYDGKGVIYDQPAEHIYGVEVNKNINSPDVASIKREITTQTLSTFIEKENIHVDVIKIDVENHLPEALEGIGKHLGSMKPTMILEVLNKESGEKAQRLLDRHGYLYFDLDESNVPQKKSAMIGRTHCNYLACTKDKAGELGLL